MCLLRRQLLLSLSLFLPPPTSRLPQLKPKRLPCVLLLSPAKRHIAVVKSKEIPNYEAGCIIPSNVRAIRGEAGDSGT